VKYKRKVEFYNRSTERGVAFEPENVCGFQTNKICSKNVSPMLTLSVESIISECSVNFHFANVGTFLLNVLFN